MKGDLGRSMKVFFLPLRWKSIFPSRTAFLIMVRVETFFLLMRLPPPNLLSLFSNGDIPKSQWSREKGSRSSKNRSDSR